MKKTFFFIIILLGILFFSATDYFLNVRGSITKIPADATIKSEEATTPSNTQYNIVRAVLDQDKDSYGYQIASRSRTKQLFERIDLGGLNSVAVFRNQLDVIPSPISSLDPMVIYEVQGQKAQGSLTYLAVKLKFIKQKDSTETINEIGGYGMNSFFFNDTNYPKTAFLVTQIGDNLLAFQYNKSNKETFKTIRRMTDDWVKKISNN